MIASCVSCKETLRPALGLEAGRRGPVAPCAGMGAHCSSAGAIRCVALAQDALCRARRVCRLRDLALRLSILRRIPSREAATGFLFPGANTAAGRRGLVKEGLSATHADQCAIRQIRTCTSMAPSAGIDVRVEGSTNGQVSFCFPTQAEFRAGHSLPLVSPQCRPSFRHRLDQGLTCVTDYLLTRPLCCVRCWRRPRSPRRSPSPGAVARRPSAATCNPCRNVSWPSSRPRTWRRTRRS